MLGRQRTYSASDLKLIAMGTMVLDHLAFHLMERGGMDLPMVWYILGTAMRLAGRVAFPLYGFFLVQGFFHTGDWPCIFIMEISRPRAWREAQC